MVDPFKSELFFHNHSDEIVHKLTQPTEDVILERNNELRKNPGVVNDLKGDNGETWGRQVASIPLILYYNAIRNGFALNHKDSKVAEKEMLRFFETPEGKTCLIR